MSDGRIGGDRFLFRGRRYPAAQGWRWALFSVSRRTPYGSLRMPLSICVILRIYNEDAIYTHFPLALLERRDVRVPSRSHLPVVPLRPFSPSWSLSHARRRKCLRHRCFDRLNRRAQSWCFTMVIILVPPRTMSAVSQTKVTKAIVVSCITNLHLTRTCFEHRI